MFYNNCNCLLFCVSRKRHTSFEQVQYATLIQGVIFITVVPDKRLIVIMEYAIIEVHVCFNTRHVIKVSNHLF